MVQVRHRAAQLREALYNCRSSGHLDRCSQSSVADQLHFCADPDPRTRIWFYFGADLDPADPDPDPWIRFLFRLIF